MKYVGITEVIASADLLRINDFNTQTKVEMLSDIELEIQRDVMLLSTEDISLPYWPDEWNEGEVYEKGSKVSLGGVIYEKVTADEGGSPDADVSAWVKSDIYLSVPYPHAALYKHYLIALYDFYLQDYQNYANDLEMAKSHLYAFSAWWCEFVNPGTKIKEPVILSAYALAIKHGFSGSEEEWLLSLKGERGEKGDGLEIKGVVNNVSELPDSAEVGDIWLIPVEIDGEPNEWGVITESYYTGSMYIWNGSDWENIGTLKGEKGDKGEDGPKGDAGRGIMSINSYISDGKVCIDIFYTDGTFYRTSFPQPKDGEDGVGISNIYQTADENIDGFVMVINTTDGKVYSFNVYNGKTPQKGIDYWTDSDIAEIKGYVDEAILGGAW